MNDEYEFKHTEETERFGIQAHWSNGYPRFRDGEYKFVPDPQWGVSLPHQCDDWQICGEEYGMGKRTSKEEALADLDLFIEELQEARRRLLNEAWEES